LKILNASPGFGAPLTEDELVNFLTNSKLNIHIGTLDKKGEPNIHPTWYYFDTTDNRFYIETSKQSRKTENMDTNNIIYYCVDDPNPPYKGVRGKGKVKIHEDISHNIPIAEKIMIRYLGSLEHPMAKALMSSVKKEIQLFYKYLLVIIQLGIIAKGNSRKIINILARYVICILWSPPRIGAIAT
jgi:general stress protein 26